MANHIRYLDRELSKAWALDITTSPPSSSASPKTQDENRDESETSLSQHFKSLQIDRAQKRYFGKASRILLVEMAMDIKRNFSKKQAEEALSRSKRTEMWEYAPWQQLIEPYRDPLHFPELDLMTALIDLYFTHVNPFYPLLHRPSFMKSILEGLHLHDYYFGAVLLAVCAVGARYSNDRRVWCPGSDSEHSIGWQWIRQVHLASPSFISPPPLYEVQWYCLRMLFESTSTIPEDTWVLTSMGIRHCQDLGIHRLREVNTVEEELWKRAFWLLICADVFVSQVVGRPRATCIEELVYHSLVISGMLTLSPVSYDTVYPVCCDDEFWQHPNPQLAWKQSPSERPCYVSYWIPMLKLLEILGSTERTIYCVRQRDSNREKNQQVLSELDSRLNDLMHELPDHLRWDSLREDSLFFQQSAALHVTYYWVQIQIHRPFIPKLGQPSASALPSLTICATSARSCAHVVDVLLKRNIFLPYFNIVTAAFTSGTVLLINAWRRQIEKEPVDLRRELADIYKCLEYLHSLESRIQEAGRLADLLSEMVGISDLLESQRVKRAHRITDKDESHGGYSMREPRRFAGSSRALVHASQQLSSIGKSRNEVPDTSLSYPNAAEVRNDNNLGSFIGDEYQYTAMPFALTSAEDGGLQSRAGRFFRTFNTEISMPSGLSLWSTSSAEDLGNVNDSYNDWDSYMMLVDEFLQTMKHSGSS
ncbi:hypothetical protein WG66_011959 [Moniliophthora roreri]|nr:hypothetical protein WG66_011959 [Moniliophthora roreri]